MNTLDLAKKHGAPYDRNINGDIVLWMTEQQLEAIINERCKPLVDALGDASCVGSDFVRDICFKAIVEFNKESGYD